ncbi:hypothetical protein GGS20DRAFT_568418 [Poronia punctata]|nr:hypothetical protein GGS20DRAFT_568418 [Poronia punctata]
MVGLFLRHHDEAFVWKDGPVPEDQSPEDKTFAYRPGRVQPLASVPRSNFNEKKQDFETIPGYSIHFSITSQNHRRVPANWHETLQINSRQLSPLTHASAEGLFFDACYAVDSVFMSERKGFEAQHASCASRGGCARCKTHDGDGIEILVSVKNNLGPVFDNMERAVYARTNIFGKDHGEDCAAFVEKVKEALTQVREEADDLVSRIDDFEFSIVELRGRGWGIDQPIIFTRSPETFISRRSIEAVLDRLQTGVADILRGNAIAVRMTARKRGHFVLDKTLVSREPIEKSTTSKKKSAAKSKEYVLDKLRQRIEQDIEMVCKDTCSLISREDNKPDRTTCYHEETNQEETNQEVANQEVLDQEVAAKEVAKQETEVACQEEEPTRANSVIGSQSLGDYPSLRTAITRRPSVFSTPSRVQTQDTGVSVTDAAESDERELSVKSEPANTYSYIPPSQWLKVTRDPKTGLRRFPLSPQTWNTQEAEPVQDGNSHQEETTKPTTSLPALPKIPALPESPALSALPAANASSKTVRKRLSSDSDLSNNEQDGGVSLTYPHDHYERERCLTAASSVSVSTRPQTPSLDFGGSPSIRSALLATPKIHEPLMSAEVEFVHRSTPDVEDGERKVAERVDNYMRRLLAHARSSSSSSLKLFTRDSTANFLAPAAMPRLPPADHGNSLHEQDITSPERTPNPINLSGENSDTARVAPENVLHIENKSQEHQTLPEPGTPLSITVPDAEADMGREMEAAKEEETKTDVFSQSKPPFDFSSPHTATSPDTNSPPVEEIVLPIAKGLEDIQEQQGSEQEEEAQLPPPSPHLSSLPELSKRHTNPSPNTSSTGGRPTTPNPNTGNNRPTTPVTPVRPGLSALHLQHHRRSFGSAGYIGSFHEPMGFGMGLRQALVGASTPPPSSPSLRPFSPLRIQSGEVRRPGTAI